MRLNLQISSFMKIRKSTLLNFVKIRFVSHRKVDKCCLEGGVAPCISACSPPSIVHFRQTVFCLFVYLFFFYLLRSRNMFISLPHVIPSIPPEPCALLPGLPFRMCSEVALEKGGRNEHQILWPHHPNKFILFTHIVANSEPLLDHRFEHLSQCWRSLLLSRWPLASLNSSVAVEPLWWWKHYVWKWDLEL